MIASVQNRSRHFSPTIRANVRNTEFDFKAITLKVLIVKTVKIFDLLVLTFKVPIFIRIGLCVTIITVLLRSLLIGQAVPIDNKHAGVLVHVRERWGMPFTHFFKTKRKSSNNSTKDFVFRSPWHAGFPHFLKAFPSSVFMTRLLC